MGRPRKYNVDVPGLSCYTDARTKKVYWRYKHPVSGKFHGLGDSEAEAKAIAVEANTRFAQQQMGQLMTARDKISRDLGKGLSVSAWLDSYWKIQEERQRLGELKLSTVNQKKTPVKVMRSIIGNKLLPEITVRDIADILGPYKDRGQFVMAQVVRRVIIDVFKEAQHAGEVPLAIIPHWPLSNLNQKCSGSGLAWKSGRLYIKKPAQCSHTYRGRCFLRSLLVSGLVILQA